MTGTGAPRRPPRGFAAICLVGLTVVFVFTGTALAQEGFGVRGGLSVDPDQFYFGIHYDTGPLVDRLSFRPNVEAGLGSNRTLVAFNVEFAYRIPLPISAWSLYAGGGPAAVVVTVGRGDGHDTDAGGGFNVLVGLSHRGGLFTELKVGVIKSPSLKIGVGYSF
jgi:hypothetical protein